MESTGSAEGAASTGRAEGAASAGGTGSPGSAAFEAVLCDLDNVIRFYDTGELARLERAAGLPAGATAAVAFAPERGEALMLGRIGREEWVDAIAAGLTGQVPAVRARALGMALAAAPFRADAEVLGLLRAARDRMPVLLVTNAASDLDEDLLSLGMADFLPGVVNSARVGVAKPGRRIYEIAAAQAGVSPERCLFVDDKPENVAAAVALGMQGLHFRGVGDLREVLAAAAAG
ncbi:HAD-IA family hydrolase [Streptomyces sp. JJ36]|uniref:HAD-IA family hydrolase n=1 Tax=Streptomyces sp. JJ36 TaxID=2736645 RepID=UPI001F008BC1|nr:HAD-IA family hydrolase [Streptomyces sp. JJ36]MCF6524184.1 HAD-IA family hydrolase [Streptomyces sp. JJ36]